MPGLIIWKNRQMDRMRRDFDQLFCRLCDDFFVPLPPGRARDVPLIDLSETEDKIILKAHVPGLNPEDLDITITDDILSIKGVTKQEQRYIQFSRKFRLPCRIEIDDVEALYNDEVLRILMPKCTSQDAERVKIKVK